MIVSFGSKETERIWHGYFSRKYPPEIQNISRRKLRMLNNSQSLKDLTVPPSNRLERLKGNFEGFYSIRINDQWRIIFRWENNMAIQVQITDYH
jgi:toxin HigB-1